MLSTESDMDTDTNSDTSDQPQLSGIVKEGEVADHDQDSTVSIKLKHWKQ